MRKIKQWDCGSWSDAYAHNRITVRERGDGFYDLLHVRFVRTREGMRKTESPVGVYRDLAQAREAGWALWRQLRG